MTTISIKENSKLHSLLKAAQEVAEKELEEMDKIQFITSWRLDKFQIFITDLNYNKGKSQMSLKQCVEENAHVNNETYLNQVDLWIDKRAFELIEIQLEQIKTT